MTCEQWEFEVPGSSYSWIFFFFPFYGFTCGIRKFPVLGRIGAAATVCTTVMATLDSSCICVTYATDFGNARSFTHRLGIETTSSQRQPGVLNLLSHNGNSYFSILNATELLDPTSVESAEADEPRIWKDIYKLYSDY